MLAALYLNENNKFCRMERIVACESRRAPTIPVRSPLSRVTPALRAQRRCRSTWRCPRRTPPVQGRLDAVAGHGHDMALLAPSGDDLALSVGQDAGFDLVDAQPVGEGWGSG